jgi:tetratricopeptide (TPR) repeat protein
MILKYCQKCNEVDKSVSKNLNQSNRCPRCREKILYLSIESVSISPAEMLEEYDRHHINDPTANFSGVSTQSAPMSHPISVFESDALLQYNPKNCEALQFLSVYYLTQAQFILAKSYISKWIDVEVTVKGLQLMVAVSIYTQDWDAAIHALKQLDVLAPQNPVIEINRGRICLLQDDFKAALTHFYLAYSKARSSEERRVFKRLLTHVAHSIAARHHREDQVDEADV